MLLLFFAASVKLDGSIPDCDLSEALQICNTRSISRIRTSWRKFMRKGINGDLPYLLKRAGALMKISPGRSYRRDCSPRPTTPNRAIIENERTEASKHAK